MVDIAKDNSTAVRNTTRPAAGAQPAVGGHREPAPVVPTGGSATAARYLLAGIRIAL